MPNTVQHVEFYPHDTVEERPYGRREFKGAQLTILWDVNLGNPDKPPYYTRRFLQVSRERAQQATLSRR